MNKKKYIRRYVSFEEHDYVTVKRHAEKLGLGGKGFSAALRHIIREWDGIISKRFPPPAPEED